MSSKIEDMPQKTLPCWPLAFSAGLLSIGQDDLLVALLVLVIQTNLSLFVWTALLMLGSMLFLPPSLWWGKQISLTSSETVVLWALGRYGVSFTLLGLGSMSMAIGVVITTVGLGILIIAWIVYGLVVSTIVPACQVWVLQRAGEGSRMAVLATISSGLSCGRLLGPLCAAAILATHPLALVRMLMTAPVWVVVVLLWLPGTSPQPTPGCKSVNLKRDYLPYLLCTMLLAVTMSMIQFGLSSALTRQFDTDTTATSQRMAWLLGLPAIAALVMQFVVLRPQHLVPVALPLNTGVPMSSGLATMLTEQLWLFYLGCVVLLFGAALATPAYRPSLNDKLADGTGTNWLATSHTSGYGLYTLLVPLASKTDVSIAPIMTVLFAAVLFTIVSACIQHYRIIK